MGQSEIYTRKNIKPESEAKAKEGANAVEAAEASEAAVLLCCILTYATACLVLLCCVAVLLCCFTRVFVRIVMRRYTF